MVLTRPNLRGRRSRAQRFIIDHSACTGYMLQNDEFALEYVYYHLQYYG